MYENALEIVLLNKDPNKFVYYPKNFKNETTNSNATKRHIQHIVNLGTPMTPEFLEIVKKFSPVMYNIASKNPMYNGQPIKSTGIDLKVFLVILILK
jgi:hypothetical protein